MKPFRLILQETLTEVFKTIKVANGYETDLADNAIFRGRVKFGQDDPIPSLTMFEPPVNEDVPFFAGRNTTTGKERLTNYSLIVQGFIKDGDPHPTDPAYVFSADVTKALATARSRTGPNKRSPDPFGHGEIINKVTIFPPIVRPSDDISASAYFWMLVTFELAEDMTDPMM